MLEKKAGKKSRREGDGQKKRRSRQTDAEGEIEPRVSAENTSKFNGKTPHGSNMPFLQQPTVLGRAS